MFFYKIDLECFELRIQKPGVELSHFTGKLKYLAIIIFH